MVRARGPRFLRPITLLTAVALLQSSSCKNKQGDDEAPVPFVAPATVRVSADSKQAQGNLDSYSPSISADGRYVAFQSLASNLVADDSNGTWDIFVRDNATGTTVRASVDSSGSQGNSDSRAPAISADGRYVVFESVATNLVPGDTNGAVDIFVRDLVDGTTARVSVESSGLQGDAHSYHASISFDGRYVAFRSDAANLVAGDTNSASDVFVRDTIGDTTIRVSVDSSGFQSDGDSDQPSLSGDGRYVAFWSMATNLAPGDTNGEADIFVRDLQGGTTMRVSVDSSGLQSDDFSEHPSISSDGRAVAFRSGATNLVAGDTNGDPDIFVRDMKAGTTVRASIDSSGVQGNGFSSLCSISVDGRYVTFGSSATNLVAGDTNGAEDVFVRDLVGGTTVRISVDSSGAQGNDGSFAPSMSADGRFVAFATYATNLAAGDTNGSVDTLLRGRLR